MRCPHQRFHVRSIFGRGAAAWALYRAASQVFALPPTEVWEAETLDEAWRLVEEFLSTWPQDWVFQGPDVSITEVPCPCGRHLNFLGYITTESSGRHIIVVSHRGWHPCVRNDVVVVDFRAKWGLVPHSAQGSVYAAWEVLYNLPCGVARSVRVILTSGVRIPANNAFELAHKVLESLHDGFGKEPIDRIAVEGWNLCARSK